MLKQRVITAVLMAALFLSLLLWAPSPVFIVFVLVIILLAGWEWANLSGLHNSVAKTAYALGVFLLAAGCIYFPDISERIPLQTLLMGVGLWWAVALLWIQSYPGSQVFWKTRGVRLVIGLLVLVPTVMSLDYLHTMEHGYLMVLAIVFIVASADIGAYFTGKAFGKRKLAPAVSPGKTWEGVLGGMVAALLIMNVFLWVFDEPNFVLAASLALPTALISVVGDLFESMLKRYRGIKDSGKILPGHGGILDRIDGLVAAIPMFALVAIGTGWQL